MGRVREEIVLMQFLVFKISIRRIKFIFLEFFNSVNFCSS